MKRFLLSTGLVLLGFVLGFITHPMIRVASLSTLWKSWSAALVGRLLD